MVSYWRYLVWFFGSFLAGLLLFVTAVFYQMGAPTPSSQSMFEFIQAKEAIAATVPSPKITLIGGSSVRLGLSCAQIFESLELPCLNGGTSLISTAESMLYRASKWLKPGDTAVLLLEYELYDGSRRINADFIDYVFARQPDYLFHFDLVSQFQMIFGMSWNRLWEGLSIKFENSSLATRETFGRERLMNELGDSSDNLESQMTQKMLDSRDSFQPFALSTSSFKSKRSLDAIASFVRWCRKNDVRVLVSWPNLMRANIYQKPIYQDFFNRLQEFYKRLDVPVLGKPQDFMYHQDMFYDSAYHLHDRGVKKHTEDLIALIKNKIYTN